MEDTNKLLEYESSIKSKLKEMMKLAKEIGVLSETYTRKNQLEPAYEIFNKYSDEMKILKSILETYGIAE